MRAAPSVSRAPGLPLLRRCSWTSWRRPPTASCCHRLTRFHGAEDAVDDAELLKRLEAMSDAELIEILVSDQYPRARDQARTHDASRIA